MTDEVANSLSGHGLERRLAESWPVGEWRDTHVVLGVSGGADSVAMLRAMVALKMGHAGRGKLHIAHLNHGLRGSAADADEGWLRALCERFELPLDVQKMDVSAIAAQQGDGWEAAARSARYEFLGTVANRIGGRFVVTAHTKNDQVETVLHRVIRGTGIEGLAGMTKARPLTSSVALVRPMLEMMRSDVLEYLTAIGQDYRTDATNDDTQWTRNRLRHELLPQLRYSYNAQVDGAILRLAAQAGEAQQVIAELAMKLAEKCVEANSSQTRVDCRAFAGQPAIVVREVFRFAWRQAGWPEQSMGFDKWEQLASIATGVSSQTLNLPGGVRAKRDGQVVLLQAATR